MRPPKIDSEDDSSSTAAVAAMIERLRADGAAEPGTFTIDRAEAHRQMAAFQLPDKALYVLDLVQLAVCKQATRLELDHVGRRLRLSFDGAPITAEDVALAHSTLFFPTADSAPPVRARARLALALGMVTARGARLELTSGDGRRGERLVVEGGPEQVDEVSDVGPGTRIELDFVDGSPEAELTLLRERVRFASLPILLNGERLDAGFELRDAFVKTACDTEEAPCQMGFEIRRRGGRMLLVTDGVLLAEHAIDNTRDGFVALVEASSLRRDLSGWELVRDDRFDAVVSGIRKNLRAWTGPGDLESLRDEALQEWLRQTLDPLIEAMVPGLRRRTWILHALSSLPAIATVGLLSWLLFGLFRIPTDCNGVEYLFGGILVAAGTLYLLTARTVNGFVPGTWLDEQAQVLRRVFQRPGELELVKARLAGREGVHGGTRKALLRRLELP